MKNMEAMGLVDTARKLAQKARSSSDFNRSVSGVMESSLAMEGIVASEALFCETTLARQLDIHTPKTQRNKIAGSDCVNDFIFAYNATREFELQIKNILLDLREVLVSAEMASNQQYIVHPCRKHRS